MRSTPRLGVAALAMCGSLLRSGEARAFCREVTASPAADYDPSTQGCFHADADGGELPPLFWRNECVSYSFQRQGSKFVPAADATRIAAQAFATWSGAACDGGRTPDIVAVPYPVVDCDTAGSQGHNNVILFRDDGWPYTDSANAIGYTTLTIALSTGEILGADIEINSTDFTIVADGAAADAGSSPSAPTTYDLGSILTHEAGHFLGLAHSSDSNAIMYAHYHPGSTSLTPDDSAGICSIYGPDSARNTQQGPVAATACNPAPPMGFSTTCGSLDAGTFVGSGPLPDHGNADAESPCLGPTCAAGDAIGSAHGSTPGNVAVCGFTFLVGLVGLVRRRRGRMPSKDADVRWRPVWLLLLVAVGSTFIDARDAKASVSSQALFEELVFEASAVAIVAPAEHRSVWEAGRIITYTRIRVERLVAGQVGGDAWVRTLGGAVGDIGQRVEGEPTFAAGQSTLVFLAAHLDPTTHAADGAYVVVERAQGQFPIAPVEGGGARLAHAVDLGAIVPPPPDHYARALKRLPPGAPARFAREVLEGRSVDDGIREIAQAWALLHAP